MKIIKKTSINYNLEVINDVLTQKKEAIHNNRYSKSVPLAIYMIKNLLHI